MKLRVALILLMLPSLARGGTVVTLTFDDTLADQDAARPILSARGLHATFYVNSGRIDESGYLTLDQIRDLAADGNEIAGHTVNHVSLTSVGTDEQTRQICDDRAQLLALGFPVTSFAYPFADQDLSTSQIVIGCGYNSARSVGGLESPTCTSCPAAEQLPPDLRFQIRSAESIKSDTTLATIEGYVTDAETAGGGWVPLVMHHVCDGCNPDAVSAATLSALADWLAARAASGTVVKTVQDVIGGPPLPPVNGPRPAPRAPNLLANPSFETGAPDCWDAHGDGTFARSTRAHTGAVSGELTLTPSQNDSRVVSSQDLGECAPPVDPTHTYTVSVWYAGSPSRFVAYARNGRGAWHYLSQSRDFSQADDWASAR
jgi:peptidoglycan/xylan/chitin deacetylase (PgdA/CDA1 family)